MRREIFLDTETTGLKPENGHKLIEICAMEVVNGLKSGNIFHHYINPQREVPYEAFKIHGISTEFLLDKKLFSDIAKNFVDFIAGAKLVIHNAKFDVGFLNYELKNIGLDPINNDNVIDTLEIARKKHPGSPASLDALCKRYKINLSKRDKHGALIDVELLYEVYRYLTDENLLIKTEQKKEVEHKRDLQVKKQFKISRNFACSQEEMNIHKEFIKQIKDPIWNN